MDALILRGVHQFSSPWLDSAMLALTNLGDAIFVVAATFFIAGVLLYTKQHKAVAILLCTVGGAAFLNVLLKFLVQRVRPDIWAPLVVEHSYSFPSGHAMASSALAFAVVLVTWHTKWRWYAVVFGGLYMLLIGFSRLYLGVHYPTDVLAGWIVSLIWVLAVKLIVDMVRLRYAPKKPAKQ